MIHEELIQTIKAERQNEDFVLPFYGRYSIAEVVPTVLTMFGIPQQRAIFPADIRIPGFASARKVLLFMVDGLGFDHFRTYQSQLEFFTRLGHAGEVYPITSVFPSTTPAALTTLHTGLTPQEHGLPEWFVYFEEVNSIIETLPFKAIRTDERDNVLKMGGSAEMLYNGETIYEILREAGIPSYVFIYHEYAHSTYSSMTQKGAEVVPFTYGTDLMEKLQAKLIESEGKGYFFVYWNQIDSVEHHFGPHSPEHVKELESFSNLVQNFLTGLPSKAHQDTVFLMTADHGQSSIKGEDIIFLNQYLELTNSYLWGSGQQSILPTGAPHDVFLFIHPPKIPDTLKFLKDMLHTRAEVITIEEAIKRGLFGLNSPSPKFLRRIGNIIILPKKNYHVWYDHFPGHPYHQKGMHGGLTEEEMVIPFAAARLSDLVSPAAT